MKQNQKKWYFPLPLAVPIKISSQGIHDFTAWAPSLSLASHLTLWITFLQKAYLTSSWVVLAAFLQRHCALVHLCALPHTYPLNPEWPLSVLLANEIIFLWIWLNVTYTNKSAALISVKINLFPAQTLPRHLVFIELLAVYTVCLELNVMCLPTPLRRNQASRGQWFLSNHMCILHLGLNSVPYTQSLFS